MSVSHRLCVVLLLLAIPGAALYPQFRSSGLTMGFGGGGTIANTKVKDDKPRFNSRVFLRYGMTDALQGDIGIGASGIGGKTYKTFFVPIDYRFLVSPFATEGWNPYLYAGFGALYYEARNYLKSGAEGPVTSDWTGVAPGGIGIQIGAGDNIIVEASGGFNYSLTDGLNNVIQGKNDSYWSFLVGLTTTGQSGDADSDLDGLPNNEEKQLGTDRKKADTDGDGLTDGDEVRKYRTDPLSTDSDHDGVTDADEVLVFKSDPNKADSDGDGLSDSDEIRTYKTDPMKKDTDEDGLADNDELQVYHTDPLKADTDADRLNDGDEVLRYKTDPLKQDTDGGSVYDGKEVENKTDPLVADDDIPKKKEEIVAEVGKPVILEGVVFKSGSSQITLQSEDILMKAYNTLAQHPDIQVVIEGHTDSKGKRSLNMKLARNRADAVKAYLVAKGIDQFRVTTRGIGPDQPIAPNSTEEGRQKNRRIEFLRLK